MSTTWNGNHTPTNDDMWDLVGDMRKQAILNNRVIPVFSKSERDGLAESAPDGVLPDGTVVVRMDQVAKGAVFDVFSSGKWHVGDTGILTTGVSIQASGVSTIDSYSMVRTGPVVTARIDLTYTGPDMEASAQIGNIPDTDLVTIESAWSPIWATYDVVWSRPGTTLWFGRVDSNGVGAITHGLPGNKLFTTQTLRLDGSWRIA